LLIISFYLLLHFFLLSFFFVFNLLLFFLLANRLPLPGNELQLVLLCEILFCVVMNFFLTEIDLKGKIIQDCPVWYGFAVIYLYLK
jgi:hypothetical protein